MMSQDLNVCWSCLVSATLSVVILSCVTQGIPVPRNFSSFRNIILPNKSKFEFYDKSGEDISQVFESNSSDQTLPQSDTEFIFSRDFGPHMKSSFQKHIELSSLPKDENISYNMKFAKINITDDVHSDENSVPDKDTVAQFHDTSIIPNLNLGDFLSEYNEDKFIGSDKLFANREEFGNLNNSFSHITYINRSPKTAEKITSTQNVPAPFNSFLERRASYFVFPFLWHARNGKSVKRFADKLETLSHTLENVTNDDVSPVVTHVNPENIPTVVQDPSKAHQVPIFPEITESQERTNNQNLRKTSSLRLTEEVQTLQTERKTKIHFIESTDKDINVEQKLPEFIENTEIFLKKVTWKNNSVLPSMIAAQHYNITDTKANHNISVGSRNLTNEPVHINSVKIENDVTELTKVELDKTNNTLNDTVLKMENRNKTLHKQKNVSSSTSLITDSIEHNQISLLVGMEVNSTREPTGANVNEENITAVSIMTQTQNRQVAAHIIADNMNKGLDGGSITGIVLGVVAISGVVGTAGFILYRRHFLNKPQSLNDRCSNPDSSGYIDDSSLRENSEEMYSLDNDSFLNSLEAMTIQNYWTDNVKHTKL